MEDLLNECKPKVLYRYSEFKDISLFFLGGGGVDKIVYFKCTDSSYLFLVAKHFDGLG